MPAPRGFIVAALALALGLAVAPLALWGREEAGVSVQASKTQIDFKVGGSLVTSYLIDPKLSKPYFYPVYALPGQEITENGPSDHIHHRSIWFCHGDVIPEGLDYKKHFKDVKGVDFWSERKGLQGRIRCVRVDEPMAEKGHAWVTTANEWRTAEDQKVLDETRTIHLYHLGPNANLLVLDADLHASEAPITFGDTKEGSMAIRIRPSVRADKKGKGTLTNADGKVNEGKGGNKDKKGCWGLVSAWCDYSGPVGDGKTAGLAIFAEPTNKVDSAWHARNYGLLAANPFGRAAHARFPDREGNNELVKLKKGEHLKLRYGVYLHAGDVKEGKVAEAYAKFTKLKAGS
jgi:hypothetical protein